ncbi:hypothetical protein Hdeb2414_s0001g00026511 [Helianthus debilis subsp. tardiflorus]
MANNGVGSTALLLVMIWNAVLLCIYWEMDKNNVEGSRFDLLAYSIKMWKENEIFMGLCWAFVSSLIVIGVAKTLPEEYFRKIAKTVILATGMTILALATADMREIIWSELLQLWSQLQLLWL